MYDIAELNIDSIIEEYKCRNMCSIELVRIFENGVAEEFHDFMNEHADVNNINLIAARIIMTCGHNTNLMKILIESYGFKINQEFMDIVEDEMSADMFVLFHNYFVMTSYNTIACKIFNEACIWNELHNIKKIIDLGYNVNQLIKNRKTRICRLIWDGHYATIEYLLSVGLDFKKYELDVVRTCIYSTNVNMLILFINYGADLEILNKLTHEKSQDIMKIYQILESYGIEPALCANLFIN